MLATAGYGRRVLAERVDLLHDAAAADQGDDNRDEQGERTTDR